MSEAEYHYNQAERLYREAEHQHYMTDKLHHSYDHLDEEEVPEVFHHDNAKKDDIVYEEPVVHHPYQRHHQVYHEHYAPEPYHEHYAPEPVLEVDEDADHLLSYEEFKLKKHERQAFDYDQREHHQEYEHRRLHGLDHDASVEEHLH